MNHRLLALGSVAALALGISGALAADIPARGPAIAPAPVIFAPAFTWTGFYVGLNGGYGGSKFEYPYNGEICSRDDCVPYGGKPSITSGGGLFGGQIGYNWQFGNGFVLGAEADYQWSNIEGKVNINGAISDLSAELAAGSEITSFGTVRARLGYGWDRTLLYVTGGWAYGRVKSGGAISLCGDADCFDGSLSKRSSGSGWTLGAGLEYAITNNLSFKTEYLYVDLGKKSLYSATYDLGRIDATAALDVDTRFHVVRAGLNWRFWSPAAPVTSAVLARY